MGKRPGVDTEHPNPKDSLQGNYLRNSQVARFYKVLILLETSRIGLTVKELKDSLSERGLEVTERTIYRDLEGLRQAGFPIITKDYFQPGGKKFLLDKGLSVASYLVFSPQELFAMHITRSSLGIFERAPLFASFQSFFHKIFSKINSQSQEVLEDLGKHLHIEYTPKLAQEFDENMVGIIRKACSQRRLISFNYHPQFDNDITVLQSAPEFLYFSQGSLYLVSRDHPSENIQLYAVNRMRGLNILNSDNKNEVLDKNDFLKKTFGSHYSSDTQQIMIRFEKEIAEFVRERRWHSTQINLTQPDGSLLVTFELSMSSELIRWVLSFGSNAEVIKPKILRTQIFAELEKMTCTYNNLEGVHPENENPKKSTLSTSKKKR